MCGKLFWTNSKVNQDFFKNLDLIQIFYCKFFRAPSRSLILKNWDSMCTLPHHKEHFDLNYGNQFRNCGCAASERNGWFLTPFFRTLSSLSSMNDFNECCSKNCRLVPFCAHHIARIRTCCSRNGFGGLISKSGLMQTNSCQWIF